MAASEITGSVVQLMTAIVEYRRFLAEQQRQQLLQQNQITERQLELAQTVGHRQSDVRSELAEQATRLDPQRTREVQDQLYAQYRQDAATWNRAADPQWWQRANSADVAEVWRASTAWRDVDPTAELARHAAGERLVDRGVRLPDPGERTHRSEALSQAVRSAAERQGHGADVLADHGRAPSSPQAARSTSERAPADGRGTDGRGPAGRSPQQRAADGRRGVADAEANRQRAAAADDRGIAGSWRDVRLDAEQGLAPGTDEPAYAEARADHAHEQELDFTAEAGNHDQLAAAAAQTASLDGPAGAPAPQSAEGRSAQAAARAYPTATRGTVARSAVRRAGARGVAGRGRAQPQPVRTQHPAAPTR